MEQSPKGGRTRVVPIDAGTVANLAEHRRRQRERQVVVLDSPGLVVCHPDGRPYKPDAASAAFARIARKVGLGGYHLHDARHAPATHLFRMGEPLHVVAARLGHKDAIVTATVYAHVLDEQATGASDAFARAMGDA